MPDIGGLGVGGKGGNLFLNGSHGNFTKQTVNTSASYCQFFGIGYLNGYYFGSNQLLLILFIGS